MKQTVLQTNDKTISAAMRSMREAYTNETKALQSATESVDSFCVKMDKHKTYCMLPLVDFSATAKFDTFKTKWGKLFTDSDATLETKWEACRTLYTDLKTLHTDIKDDRDKKGLKMQALGQWIQHIKRNMQYCPDVAKRSKPAAQRAKAAGIKFPKAKTKKAATATAAGTRRKAEYLGNALNGDIAKRIAEIRSFCDTTGTKTHQAKCKAIESALETLVTKVAAIEGVLK
jgi:hypothetical protein